MKKRSFRIFSFLIIGVILSVSSVFADWLYYQICDEKNNNIVVSMKDFEYKPKERIYITNSELISNSNNVKVSSYSHLFPTNFKTSFKSTQSNSSMTYKITVTNNTNYTYSYMGVSVDTSEYNNSYVNSQNGVTIVEKDNPNDSYATFNTSDVVLPKETRVFYATYTIGSNAINKDITLEVNFKFSLRFDDFDTGFLAVLNDSEPGGKYEYLVDLFEDKYNSSNKNYIGNGGGETHEDTIKLNELFGGAISMNVNGEDVPVTILIVRKDVDGQTSTGDNYQNGKQSNGTLGSEYTIYFTTESLDKTGVKTSIVYILSFSRHMNSDGSAGLWYQIGQTYEGSATSCDYDEKSKAGSIDPTTWKANNKTYEPIQGYRYTIGNNSNMDSIEEIMQITLGNDPESKNKFQNDILTPANNMLRNNKNNPAYDKLRQVFEAASSCYILQNGGAGIEANSKATRAEMINHMIAIKREMDALK